MKVYFLASFNQKDELGKTYLRIVEHLNKRCKEVYEKVLIQHDTKDDNTSSHSVKEWYREWSEYIHECDFAVAEVSEPSSARVGFEIGMILSRGKPVIVLHRSDRDPVHINKLYSPKVVKSEYTDNTLEEVIDWCIEEVEAISDKRFTFYISSEIDTFLERRSNDQSLSRSEVIRMLIENEMKK